MPNSISPVDGSVLPTKVMYDFTFTYAPVAPGNLSIPIKFVPTDANCRFLKTEPQTDAGGISQNQVVYAGATPTVPVEIAVKKNDGSEELLLTFSYNFADVEFVGADANGGGISYPSAGGMKTVWTFGGTHTPTQDGVMVTVQAVQHADHVTPVENLAVLFSAKNNALTFYEPDGTPIAPMAQEEGSTETRRYPYNTDSSGEATVIAMSSTSGIFVIDVGGTGYSQAHGPIVVLDEFAPDAEHAIDGLNFPTMDDTKNKIDLDATPGPVFPVSAPASILNHPVAPDSYAVVVVYPEAAEHKDGEVVVGPISALSLTQDAWIAKSKVSDTANTNFYYMASNGVASWQSSMTTAGAYGSTASTPPNVPRIKFGPTTPDFNTIDRDAITGGLKVAVDSFLMTALAGMGLAAGDRYAFRAYLDGWEGNSANKKDNVVTKTGTLSDTFAFTDFMPQGPFTGYGHNGSQVGNFQLEFVGYPAGKDPVYSALTTMALDTTG